MKVIFITGSLEYGKDGVGDYTRVLAADMISKYGIEVLMIAFNDRLCNSFTKEEQTFNGVTIPVVRMPESLNERQRLDFCKKIVNEFNPDWISLQYVPYSYHKKGIPFSLAKKLKQLTNGAKWHIMFHELWIAMNVAPHSFKTRLTRFLQQRVVNNLVKELSPTVVHTHSTLYLNKLKEMFSGANVSQLHLFGNISITAFANPELNADVINMVVFGGVRESDRMNEFAVWCANQQQQSGKKIHIHFIGKTGETVKKWVESLKSVNIYSTEHGFLDDKDISRLFTKMQVGLSTTPYMLVEKSGAVAAMLDHHLPVVCAGKTWVADTNIKITLPVFDFNPKLNLEEVINASFDGYLGKDNLISNFVSALKTN